MPYFINLGPNRDATIEPIMTTSQGPVLAGEYRERYAHGELMLNGSVTDGTSPNGNDAVRGHIKGFARFDLGPHWRTGADIYRTSDDTYLATYRFSSDSLLASRAFLEGFHGRDYTVFEGYSFQGLRSDDIGGQTPLVLPLARYSFVGEPGRLGGRWELNAEALQITRSQGTDTRHISVKPGWRLPMVADDGEVYTLFATVQADLYQTDDLNATFGPGGPTGSDVAGRFFPQAGIDWRYPLVRHDGATSEVVEPIVGVVVAPPGGNPTDIPNEDSQDFELQDTNIFAANRFGGLDRVEGGQRVYYGMRATVLGPKNASGSLLLGQSYSLQRNGAFVADTGLHDHLSDMVGRVEASPSELLDFLYRFRLDHRTFAVRRQEIGATVGPAGGEALGELPVDRQPGGPARVRRARGDPVRRQRPDHAALAVHRQHGAQSGESGRRTVARVRPDLRRRVLRDQREL